MMETAMKLRADLIRGTADPVLFMDIDDRTLSQYAPRAGAPSPCRWRPPRAA